MGDLLVSTNIGNSLNPSMVNLRSFYFGIEHLIHKAVVLLCRGDELASSHTRRSTLWDDKVTRCLWLECKLHNSMRIERRMVPLPRCVNLMANTERGEVTLWCTRDASGCEPLGVHRCVACRKLEIKSKTIGLYQITDITDLY